MIGSGVFVSPGSILLGTGSVALSLIIWAGCGIISTIGKKDYNWGGIIKLLLFFLKFRFKIFRFFHVCRVGHDLPCTTDLFHN